MSNELIAILGVGAALAGIMLSQVRNLRTDLAQRFDDKIDALGKRLDGKIDALGKRVDDKIDALGKRVDDKIDALGERVDGKIDALGERVDGKIDVLGKRFDEQVIEIREVKKNVHGLGERMAHLEGLVEGLKEAVVARIAA